MKVNQPTKMPTQKMWAVIVAGVITGAITGGLDAAWPGNELSPVIEGWDQWITAGVMIVAGWFKREKQHGT